MESAIEAILFFYKHEPLFGEFSLCVHTPANSVPQYWMDWTSVVVASSIYVNIKLLVTVTLHPATAATVADPTKNLEAREQGYYMHQ